jgi:Fic family protein
VRADAGIREAPGTRIAPPFGETIYTPPEGADLIRAKLANLEAFIHADNGLDPLVKLAVMHYQFEAIHPFADGNGRTGRVLNSLYLVERGLLDLPVLYLSGFILERRGQYYDLLRRVTEEGAWEDWIVYMLEAVEVTAADTRQRISDIRGLMGDALARAKDAGIAAAKQEMIELIFHQPYCKIGFVTNGGLAKRETASRYLRELEALGLLRSIRAGRDTYYVNDALISVLRRAMESATP